MKQNKKSFRHESLQDQQSILKILAAVTEGLEKGRLVLSDENDEIVLSPQGLLQLKLSAAQEDNRYSFSLKVSWQTEDEKITKKNILHISTEYEE
jgi:amphi-Trp domain-containing protein